ncbi:hypothetical protein [Marinobacter sp.]|uniref:hypothetical protein n=1 Tax=Marinobacter sp. TaxID=50741 RepID=UPI00384CCE5D
MKSGEEFCVISAGMAAPERVQAGKLRILFYAVAGASKNLLVNPGMYHVAGWPVFSIGKPRAIEA